MWLFPARRGLLVWQAEGVWQHLHCELLRQLNAAGRIDWSTSVVEAAISVRFWGVPHRALAG
jgi:hypothetical protein